MAALLLTPALALAQEEFEGNVVAGDTVAVTAPFGGTIRTVDLQEGSLLNVGDAIATVDTTRVYAPVDVGAVLALKVELRLLHGQRRLRGGGVV